MDTASLIGLLVLAWLAAGFILTVITLFLRPSVSGAPSGALIGYIFGIFAGPFMALILAYTIVMSVREAAAREAVRRMGGHW